MRSFGQGRRRRKRGTGVSLIGEKARQTSFGEGVITGWNGDILAVCLGGAETKELSCGHCFKNRILQMEDHALQEEMEKRAGEKQRGRQTEGGMCFRAPQYTCRVTMMSPARPGRMEYNGAADKFGGCRPAMKTEKTPPMRGGGQGPDEKRRRPFSVPGEQGGQTCTAKKSR